jgi:hypothetical protein
MDQHLAVASEIGPGALHSDVVSLLLFALRCPGGYLQTMPAKVGECIANT